MSEGDWFNLGHRAHARGFRAAAEELARILGRAADLGPGMKILDAGFGSGAQFALWLDEFRVARVRGVELNDSPAFARGDSRLELSRGDAARLSELVGGERDFDRVLALDCAYHFDGRRDFLRGAFACLRSGGRLALTDIVPRAVPESGSSHSLSRRLLFRLCGLPSANMHGLAEYRATLEEIGFQNIRIQLLDRAVLGGFAKFARRNRLNRGCPMSFEQRLKFLVTGFLLGSVNRRRIFHYVLVTADKK